MAVTEARRKQTLDDTLPGQWVQRQRATDKERLTLWHHVETVTNGVPRSNCGRDFFEKPGTRLVFFRDASTSGRRCAVCK